MVLRPAPAKSLSGRSEPSTLNCEALAGRLHSGSGPDSPRRDGYVADGDLGWSPCDRKLIWDSHGSCDVVWDRW